MTRKRMHPEARKRTIRDAAIAILRAGDSLTRDRVAEYLGIPHSLVTYYYNPFYTLIEEAASEINTPASKRNESTRPMDTVGTKRRRQNSNLSKDKQGDQPPC